MSRASRGSVPIAPSRSAAIARTCPVIMFADEERTSELEEELLRAARSHADVPVTIRGDRLVHHEDVVAVLDACGLAGLSNVAVGTLEAR